MKIHDLYSEKENIDLRKRFWWERLPILRHLATKRVVAKMSDPTVDLILDHLGLQRAVYLDNLILESKDKNH